MDLDNILESETGTKFKKILIEQLAYKNIKASDIKANSSWRELGVDDIAMMAIRFKISTEYGIDIYNEDEEVLAKIDTVEQAINYIDSKRKKSRKDYETSH